MEHELLASSTAVGGAIRKRLLFAPPLDQIGGLGRRLEKNNAIFNAAGIRHGKIFRPHRMAYNDCNQNKRQKSRMMQHLHTPTNSLKLVEYNP